MKSKLKCFSDPIPNLRLGIMIRATDIGHINNLRIGKRGVVCQYQCVF